MAFLALRQPGTIILTDPPKIAIPALLAASARPGSHRREPARTSCVPVRRRSVLDRAGGCRPRRSARVPEIFAAPSAFPTAKVVPLLCDRAERDYSTKLFAEPPAE